MSTPASLYDRAAQSYTNQSVGTAGPESLLLLCFDKALDSIAHAEAAMEEGGEDRIWESHKALTKAQDIVSELQLSLDHERGGEIAGNLHALYGFCLERLTEANVRKDPRVLGPVSAVLSELRGAFREAASALKTAP